MPSPLHHSDPRSLQLRLLINHVSRPMQGTGCTLPNNF
ncbi:hypothetical protein LINPERPRIM_LOCUS20231 [Linum perenne]